MISALNITTDDINVTSNASRGIIKVRYPHLAKPAELTIDLLDARGKVLDVHIRLVKQDSDTAEVEINNSLPGIYFLKIFDGKTFLIKRIILQ